MTFGQYIRNLRVEHGFSVERLATRVGISKSYLDQLEADFMPPISGAVLHGLAQALDCEAAELRAAAVRGGVN